ncbi:MAG TPA: FtsX-like permease family protein [Pirellulales bacterium]
MRTPLAWKNLKHEKTRTIVGMCGVAFAVVLMLMQIGFYMAARQTATLIYSQLDFDVAIRSQNYQHLSNPGQIRTQILSRLPGVPGVAKVKPFLIGFALWNPTTEQPEGELDPSPIYEPADDRSPRNMLMMGGQTDDSVFKLPAIRDYIELLREPDTVFIDTMSRAHFGVAKAGLTTELGRKRVRIVREYTLGTGFAADGDVVVSDTTFYQRNMMLRPGRMSMGLIVAEPNTDLNKLADDVSELLEGESVDVLTRQEVEEMERTYWVVKTSVGTIFSFGAVVAFVVGISIVYQVLSSDVLARLGEFSTMKAMGYTDRYLSWVVLQQAVILAVLGYIPGLIVSWTLYFFVGWATGIPMAYDPVVAFAVFMLAVLMCIFSGLLSLQKLRKADPASLF